MSIKEMKKALAVSDADNWDYTTIYDVALEGCQGYDNMTDEEIISLYNDIFVNV